MEINKSLVEAAQKVLLGETEAIHVNESNNLLHSTMGRYLVGLGINYYDFGKVKTGNKHTHNFFKTDKLTNDQIKQLKADISGVEIKGARSEYAPEMKSVVIMIPTGKIKSSKGSNVDVNESIELDEAISPEKQKELLDMILLAMESGDMGVYNELAGTAKKITDKQKADVLKKAANNFSREEIQQIEDAIDYVHNYKHSLKIRFPDYSYNANLTKITADLIDARKNNDRQGLEYAMHSVGLLKRQEEKEAKMAKKSVAGNSKASDGNPLEIGDILNVYWSYTMSWPTYFQVVGVNKKKVTVRQISKKWVSGDPGFTGQVIPVKDAFVDKEITFTLRGNFQDKESIRYMNPPKELDSIGKMSYKKPKQDGSYDSDYENHMD